MRSLWILSLGLLLALVSASARILNVPGEYTTIQAGINASINGDTVLVAPGEYTEIDTVQDKNILLTSAQGPESTVLHGYFNLWGASIDSTCILRGFDINGNNINIGSDHLVYIRYGSPIISANIIEDNSSESWGAGVKIDTSMAIIRSNIIRDNWSYTQGGGIVSFGYPVIIEANIISGNRAGSLPEFGDEAGISARGIIRYNLITNNAAMRMIYHARAGGISTSANSSKVYNNTIIGNVAAGDGGHGYGGGVYISSYGQNGTGFIKNNIIAYNLHGNGVWGDIADSAYLNWDYNLVFGNDSANYVGFLPGPHDIQADPLFIDRFSGDYHLLSNSPCIDTGDPSLPLDPDSTRSDIGAYFFDQSMGIDEDRTPPGPYQFTLSQNYPNPFNAQTIISYNLDKEATVSLHIYSIMGHLILPLVNKEVQKEGAHKYTWEGRDYKGQMVSTGIYFYELYVNGIRESKAMILMK
ncbi:MAG TPA: hypothetical protein DEO84_06465 [candidate division Zixibacteria bacterium]|nr:hypothetical protein [candidate division Zixibacteria bacterium]